jgi:2-polyprenyl-6-methoxyphenol hydroxylase-like FAD-dependent oxidoreductase
MQSNDALHVLVIGAGLSGLCLAQALRRSGIDVDVFDRDDSPLVPHGQSYRLTIDEEGERALKVSLPRSLYDLAIATSGRPEEGLTIFNDRKEVVRRIDFSHGHRGRTDRNGRIAMDRFTLRQVLLGSLGAHIHFQKTFVRYDADGDQVVAHFEDGTQFPGDVLVGSDGTGSRVRRQLLPDAVVADTGVRAIFGRTPLLTRGEELLDHELIGDGVVALAPPSHALLVATMQFRERPHIAAARWAPDVPLAMRDDYVAWSVLFPADELDGSGSDTNALQDAAARQAKRFPPEFSRVVAEGDPTDAVLVPIQAASPVPEWETTRVTLMGDAIHAMPPLGTHDVNAALHDARILTEQLVAGGDRNVFPALRAYEAMMRRDGFGAVQRAQADLREMVGTISMTHSTSEG